MARRRKRLSRRASKRSFKRRAGTHKKNLARPMRGGWRL